MQQQLTELLMNVCEYTSAKSQQSIQQSRQQSLKKLMDRVTAFINENFHDPRLNISMIGNHFDMKPAYLSKLFKDHTGEGLLNFINKARVERAKHLIADRTKSLADVSRCAGFNELNTFIRIFRKYEGITPGRYKEMMEEKSE